MIVRIWSCTVARAKGQKKTITLYFLSHLLQNRLWKAIVTCGSTPLSLPYIGGQGTKIFLRRGKWVKKPLWGGFFLRKKFLDFRVFGQGGTGYFYHSFGPPHLAHQEFKFYPFWGEGVFFPKNFSLIF